MPIEIMSPVKSWSVLPIDAVIPHHLPRDPERTKRLTASFKKYGWKGFPVIVHVKGWCASHRMAVARELGMTEIPVTYVPWDWDMRESSYPNETSCRLERAKQLYGDDHPLTLALRIERGEQGGIEKEYL